MRGLLLLLALAIPAVLTASVPSPGRPFTCAEKDKDEAVKVAEQFINHHHHRGYKFRLEKMDSAKVEKEVSSY